MLASPAPRAHLQARALKKLDIPVMVNSCLGKMGKAVIKAADSAGLDLIPMSFGCVEEVGKTIEVFFREHPDMIVVDYTVPDAVNWDRDRLYKTVKDSNVLCSNFPTNKETVVAFLAAMEIMVEQFPGAFSGYSLKQIGQSRTAKVVISCFKKLGVSFDMDEMVGVPEEYLSYHAFHLYHLSSLNEIQQKADQRIYNIIDVLREGSMR
ncbi:hypothetical protein ACJRO7_000295 [Eucalyptus globulus]|uniref:Uncharacterized protein n=1 Tax=Eucalyptus globulus TaxID=34317 RepID=A0ABD3LSU6_EUCGL